MLGEVFVVEKQNIAVVKKGIDVVRKKRYRCCEKKKGIDVSPEV